ncbi:Rieske (2Fe-2S) protein (plasmid) [Natrinema zhouii]|uniref:Rieske (2Fe-2S) protein n=1 Tax=Natrinema zhouii TaxID=1710539 RepID=UPI001CFFC0C2|nr:Rieske (2Fe-2S) protein [Natrinema zhouii]UHQ98008.1 Rieske (2Fe-2S) protein [Natrinema zhouii]
MTKKRFEICPAAEFDAGERRIVDLDGFSVGVFNVDGEYYAMKNDCPHQRAPLCEGKLGGTTESNSPGKYEWVRPGRVVRCPWHGWEFDVTTGESVFNPHKVKAKTFETRVEPSEDENTVADGGCEGCSADLEGDEPPVETYDVEVEQGTVVVYL